MKLDRQILGWLVSMLLAGIASTVWAFETFQTQKSAQVFHDSLEKRLERIEIKLDSILDQ